MAPEETTVIGDTMETDIIGGLYMGFKAILVLSGIADKKEVNRYGYKPSLVVKSAGQIKFPLEWW